jgi:hypothetical protein
MEMTWEEPSPPPHPYVRYAEEADQLRKHPGRWALLTVKDGRKAARAMANRISTGGFKELKDGFKGVSRGCKVYIRYVEDTSGELLS